jgi:beta-lactamase superfamily II metal-dependent hydrolase
MSQPEMQPPESGVKVRMYNTGFGDCLLLAFPSDAGAYYMLIDFGVHHQYPGSQKRIPLIAEDIARATGKHLHAVAITHEHTDHLYGFKHGREVFEDEKFQIDELWLAWTEDRQNALAKELKDRYGMRVRALAAAVDQLAATDKSFADALGRVLAFEMPETLAATGQESAELQFLRAKAAKSPQKGDDYYYPGPTPFTLPGVGDVQIYVLAPPEKLAWIRSLERKSELYPEEESLDEDSAFAAAVFAAAGTGSLLDEDRRLFDRTRPFDQQLGLSKEELDKHPAFQKFFREHYGFSDGKTDGPAWRRIETDWLAASEQLALKIDSKTNNTSLVLAIELTKTQPHKVLLFAADAQVGNWLSWHELPWPDEDEDDNGVNTRDLLGRTVLYKVGHHGSHNATLKKKGLEMMTSPELVAMIPVDEDWANDVQDWEHPAHTLYKRLEQRTSGRIIRTDRIPVGNQPPPQPEQATDQEWKAFLDQLKWDRGPHRLWIQYTVPG